MAVLWHAGICIYHRLWAHLPWITEARLMSSHNSAKQEELLLWLCARTLKPFALQRAGAPWGKLAEMHKSAAEPLLKVPAHRAQFLHSQDRYRGTRTFLGDCCPCYWFCKISWHLWVAIASTSSTWGPGTFWSCLGNKQAESVAAADGETVARCAYLVLNIQDSAGLNFSKHRLFICLLTKDSSSFRLILSLSEICKSD